VEACSGETVTLPCHSVRRLGVDWRRRDLVSANFTSYVVASGFVQEKFRDRFRLNRTSRHQQSLVISRLRGDDQGRYVCVEDAGLGPRHEYQLTVRGQTLCVFTVVIAFIIIIIDII